MSLFSFYEMTLEQIASVKEATKRRVLEEAKASKSESKDSDWVVRDLWLGSPTAPAVDCFYDLGTKTAVETNACYHAQDASDLTAFTLSSVLKANETIDKGAFLGFYGLMDLYPGATSLTARAALGMDDDKPAEVPLSLVQFIRGGSSLDIWDAQHLYSYPSVSGIAENPVIYNSEEPIDIKMCFNEAAQDKQIMFRAFLAEPIGRQCTPWHPWLDTKNHEFFNKQIGAGFHPARELSREWIERLFRITKQGLTKMALDDNFVQSPDQLVFREITFGDKLGTAPDAALLDLDIATAPIAKIETWCQEDSDLTALTYSTFLSGSQTVPSDRYFGFVGVNDHSSNPELIAVKLKKGQSTMDVWQCESMYGYDYPVAGFSERPVFYRPNDPIDLQVCVKFAADDQYIQFRGLTAEKYGRISVA